MNKEFIPYKEALVLKELGFDEPCFRYNYLDISLFECFIKNTKNKESDSLLLVKNSELPSSNYTLPLYQQAFRWFRDKHGLYTHIVPEFYKDGINFNWQILWYLPKEEWTKHVISDGTGLYGDNGEYPTQEDAELACLNKLIEILKNK